MHKTSQKAEGKKENETFYQPKKNPFYHKKSTITLAVIGLMLMTWAVYAVTKDKAVSMNLITAKKADLIQEVIITGTVEPAESVNLSFEITGKVKEIFAGIGDHVEKGQKLISLNSADIQAQLNQAYAGAASANAMVQQYQAALEAQKSLLEEVKKGARPEEIRLSQTVLENAEKSLIDAKNNLTNTKAKAETDMTGVYETARASMPGVVGTGKNALLTLSDIQTAYFMTANQDRFAIENAKETAIRNLFETAGAGGWITQFISTLNGGVYGKVQILSPITPATEIENILNEVILALESVRTALNTVPIKSVLNATDVSRLEAEKAAVNTQLGTLTTHRQTIITQKAMNRNLITVAENAVNTAENNLASAADELRLKQAGSTPEQIQAQEAAVRQAEANLSAQRAQLASQNAVIQGYKAQLDKTILYAPISGLVTKMEAKVGEVVFPSSPYSDSRMTFVSIISDRNYRIETYVAEVDIAKIKIGDTSRITLDAYGNDRQFSAVVTGVDPAETIMEGIPTYKVTLEFTEESKDIKSGMTANLEILTDKKEMVIAIPQRALILKEGKKYLRILRDGNQNQPIVEEVEVETGIRGSDGTIEITKGISEGDVVVISMD